MVRRCGAKRICKSKCTKHLMVRGKRKLRSAKMARRCGARRIFKSKCTKHRSAGSIFEVAIRKNGAPLWREAHFQVKMYKTPQCGTNFGSPDPQKWHAAVARSTFVSQNPKKLTGSDHFLEGQMSKNCTRLWRRAHL